MNREIERKYLLRAYPHDRIERGELTVDGRQTIEQTYLALAEKEEIRVRKLTSGCTTSYTHTFKRGHGLSREEVEYEISEDIYTQLIMNTELSPLIKTRTKVRDEQGRVFEIDEYHQFKLMIVEAEFETEEEAHRFIPPVWFGPEVGSEQEYRNKQLWSAVQRRPFQGIGD